jgi:asparagine synthase (glutamine-hydrolysing)
MRLHATVVLSGNGGDELFTGYSGDEAIRRRDLVAALGRPLRPLLRRFERVPGLLRLPAIDLFEQAIVLEARSRNSDPEIVRDVEEGAAFLADDARAAGVVHWLDLQMLASVFWTNRDGNLRLADISGLAAQVEVRSPFFDYRLVEFAAKLPHRYKTRSLRSPAGNKFLPRRLYSRVMPAEVADAPKRGMAANIRWDRSIFAQPSYETAFASAYDLVESAGLDDGSARRAWQSYRETSRAGGDASQYTGTMMTGFMLGAWLERTRTPAAAAA